MGIGFISVFDTQYPPPAAVNAVSELGCPSKDQPH